MTDSSTADLLQSSPFNETPSSEPFNIDPDLQFILSKNREIVKNSEPKFTIYPTENNEESINRSLIHIIKRRELNKLGRYQESEKLYFEEFHQIIKKKYLSTCQYLNQRLNFDPLRVALHLLTKLPISHFSCPITIDHQHHQLDRNSTDPSSAFKTTLGIVDGLDFRVIRNEWPYAIPKEYQSKHMIVWSRLPLIDPKLARSAEELETARKRGLSGIENKTGELIEQLKRYNLSDEEFQYKPQEEEDDETERNINSNHVHCSLTTTSTNNQCHDLVDSNSSQHCLDYQIRQFVRLRWPKNKGFLNVFWFLNPVYLQSCPELPHFHVFVKKH